MCGHVGVAGKLEFKDEALMKRLLIYDYFRGPDSTGLAAVRLNGDAHIAKIASHPLDLFDSQNFKKSLTGASSKVFLGHNRLATKGAVNAVNAHPYQFDHIIGAHNGTLDTASWNALKKATGEEFGVDSQNIIHAIAKLGIEETMKHMTGAWSLVWVNLEENTLNFLRNDKRPMWTAWTEDFKKLMWASEYIHISAATKLADKDEYVLHKTPQGHRFFETTADMWYKVDLEALIKGSDSKPKTQAKILKGEGPVAATNYTHPFARSTLGASSTNKTTTQPTSVKSRKNVVHMFGDKKDPFAGYFKPVEAEELARNGCSWCWSTVDTSEPGVTIIENSKKILCHKCSPSNITTVIVDDLSKVNGGNL